MSLTDLLQTFKDEKAVVKKGPVYVEKDQEGISLKGVLQRGRLKLTRAKEKRPQGVTFRPSTITWNYCRRIKVAQLAGLITLYDEHATPKQQFTFDLGNAIHDIIQTYFWDIGILKGTWKCQKCDKLYYNLVAPTTCPSGIKSHTKKFLKYKEIQVKHPTLPISGRADGVLVIDGSDHVMDIKSIQNRTVKTNERQFCYEDLEDEGPKPDHVVQLNFYMWLLRVERGHLFYVAKNDGMIKTFAIPYDYNIIKPYIEEIQRLVQIAKNLEEGDTVILPPTCGRKECPCHEFLSKMPR